MKCGGCVTAVEQTLVNHPSVISASVNLVSRTAWVKLQNPNDPIEPILDELSSRGFSAKQKEDRYSQKELEENITSLDNWWQQWRQLIFALILLVLSVLGHLAEGGKIQLPLLSELGFHAVLATAALIWPGRKILQNGAKGALNLTPSMDTLVGLGVTSAYLASLISLIWPGVGWPCFFNEPVMLLGFVLLGRFLEERARFKTGTAIKELAKLQPNNARLIFTNKQINEVKVEELKPGDKIQLLAGDRIPVDGVVIEGSSAVDVSGITGEPLPLEAVKGTELVTGSLNLEADLILEVRRIGSETALARIIDLVEEAQARKAPIQSIADQVAGKFCYAVVTLSLLTFFFWWKIGTRIWPEILNSSNHGFFHAHHLHSPLGSGAETPLGLALQLSIAVLVIACPCALGLATPTVITVASGKAARHGWLFRGGDIIEMAASIKEIIFDKTGTLTIGRPLVVGYQGTNNPQKAIQLAASIEQSSRHPLAHAVLQEAQRQKLDLIKPIQTKTVPGKGLSGQLEGIDEIIRVGKPEWLKEERVEWDEDKQSDIDQASLKGQSFLGVSKGRKFLGLILIDDKIRQDTNIALQRLREQGLSLKIFSGDRQIAVKRLGEKLGFSTNQIGWELLPDEKLQKLEGIKNSGKAVAMVGDGINDAPALASANLGIAVGTGTQIAQDSSDLILLGDRLEALPEALLLARKTMQKIKQNLAWAFGYNLIALPVAAGFLLPKFGLLLSPPVAALLMAVSSITVVLNALSLKVS